MSVTPEPAEHVRNQFQQQLQSVFGSMPLSSRILTGAMAILVVVGLGFLVRSDHGSQSEMLFGGRLLSEQELDSVELSFSQASLNDWQREGRRISIPSETRSEYLAALQGSTVLPISIRSSVQDAIDKTTFLESSGQRIARQEHAKEIDLGHKLSAFPEIAWSSVEYDLGERTTLGGARAQSASVVVSPEGNEPLSAARIRAIKEFVRGSYSGMSIDDVVVTDTNANSLTSPSNDPRQQQQQEEQARLVQEVRDILTGYGPIRVAAYVELAPVSPTEVVPVPEIQVMRRPEQAPPAPGNRGLLSNVLEAMTQVRSNRPTRIDLQQPSSIPPTNVRSTCHAVTPVQIVQVSIGLPESYYHRVWEHAFLREHPLQTLNDIPPLHDEQLQRIKIQTEANIRTAVSPAVMAASRFSPHVSAQSNQANLASLVQIWTYPDLPAAERASVDFTANALTWLKANWQPVAFVAMGLFGLIIAARAFRTVTTPSENARGANAAQSEGVPSPLPTSDSSSQFDPEYQQLLTMVEQHPDAAADVIRQWVVKAA